MDYLNESVPRRNRLDRLTPAEFAIHNAIVQVEKVGADARLTEVTLLLTQAKNKLADYIESPATVLPNAPFDNRINAGAGIPEDF